MDSSSNRLFRFSKPEWLNNSAVRNGGVYVAGALVSIRSTLLHLHPRPGSRDMPQARNLRPNEMELNPRSLVPKPRTLQNQKLTKQPLQ